MDIMVLKTQQWLNATYGKYVTSSDPDESRFNRVPENGQTGWPTIYGLTRALQIELGIEYTADNFGPGTQARFSTLSKQPEGAPGNNQYAILQGALWCKGYGVGATEITDHFYDGTEAAVISLKQDMGLVNPNGDVTVNVMKALLSMDAFVLVDGGNSTIRSIQQDLNRKYEAYIGLKPCDGLYGRDTNTALIYAIQAEEGLPTSVANGNFGPTTLRCCPEIPYNGAQTSYYGSTYSTDTISNITKLFKSALYCNGYTALDLDGQFDQQTVLITKQFQSFYHIPTTGKADKTTWLSLLTSCGDPNRSAKACDCATILTAEKAATLKNNGYEVVGRYLTGYIGDNISKALTNEEIKIIFNAGLRFFPIYQTSGNRISYFTAFRGEADCVAAVDAATSFGIPDGTTIYFAVDFDAMDYQVTDAIIPYFNAVYNTMKNKHGSKYQIGIYGSRNICSRVSKLGYAVSSFVGDMSSGFSGNLGYPIPDNWAFDQFTTVTIGSGSGQIEIDKDAYSGRDPGVSFVNETTVDDDICTDVQPKVLINRGAYIPVYETKLSKNSVGGALIGQIEADEFYVRYHTGDYTWTMEGDIKVNRWDNVGSVHPIIFRDVSGVRRKGYIEETHRHLDHENDDETIYNDTYIPYQEPFNKYKVENNTLVKNTKNAAGYFEFTVKQFLNYYNSNQEFIGVLQPGTKIMTKGSIAGVSMPWCMYFDMYLPEGETVWKNLNETDRTGAFVDLGLQYGSMGNQRAIW